MGNVELSGYHRDHASHLQQPILSIGRTAAVIRFDVRSVAGDAGMVLPACGYLLQCKVVYSPVLWMIGNESCPY